MKQKLLILIILIIGLIALTSCSRTANPSKETTQNAESAGDNEPVKLLFYVTGPTLTNTEFRTLIADPVNKKYPHITIERVEPPAEVKLEELFSSGTIPDFSLIINPHPFIRLKVAEDLRPWIKKYKLDESRFKPVLYDHLKEFGKNGEIYSVPFNANQAILYYNKDIFDKFGEPYPPGDRQLSLEEILEIGKKLTRVDNGLQYIGYDVGTPTDLSRNLALPILDSETGKSLLTSNPEWTRVFNFAKQGFEVPGYIGKNGTYTYGRDAFLKDRILGLRVANWANMVGPLEELRQQGQQFNWDLAPIPNFKDKLPLAREAQVHSFLVSNTSKHKDEVFQAISLILTDEVQRILSRNARVPAIINPDLEKEFGADVPVLKGKNVQSAFIGQQQKTHKISEYEDQISKFVTDAAKDIAVNGVDVNTALRKTNELIDKEVEKLKKN